MGTTPAGSRLLPLEHVLHGHCDGVRELAGECAHNHAHNLAIGPQEKEVSSGNPRARLETETKEEEWFSSIGREWNEVRGRGRGRTPSLEW